MRSIPTLILFKDGQAIEDAFGMQRKEVFVAMIEQAAFCKT